MDTFVQNSMTKLDTVIQDAFADWNSEDMKPCLLLCAFWVILCFVVSILADNYSQVDKLWSITPFIYVWVYAFKSEGDQRLLLMAIVSTLWGVRLTFNFARRGGYKWPLWDGEEDYRWEHVRKNPMMDSEKNPIRWQVFNLTFICGYQHFLLWLIASPAHIAFKHRGESLTMVDWSCFGAFLCLLLLEGKADNEQYEFQEEKWRKKRAGLRLEGMEKDGFNSAKMWSLCRHPNYACEQAMWIVFSIFAVGLEGFNWSLIGCVLLMSLFTPSAHLSEGITLSKYPAYARYQKAKFMFLPFGGAYEAGKSA